MKLIAAVDMDWGMGRDGQMLVHLPADLKRFREITLGKVVVMGRKTFESLPKRPLPGRINIVLTRNRPHDYENIISAGSIKELYNVLGRYKSDDIYIIGGQSVFSEMLEKCDTALITRIEGIYDADVFFPDLDIKKNWVMTSRSDTVIDGGINTHYLEYKNTDL
jgi:dihydrofolate reductase